MISSRSRPFCPGRPARRSSRRRGAVLVETALVLPLLLLLVFGVMEYGHFVFTRQTFEDAAQRGAREGMLSSATDTSVSNAVATAMNAAGYAADEYDVAFTDATDDSRDVTVVVSADWGDVGIRPFGLIAADRTLSGTVTVMKEGL